MKLVLTITAKKEIHEAAKWYNERQTGLGKRFTSTIKEELSFIQKSHQSYQIRYKNIHTAVVSVFPYMIHYTIDRNIITVVAVMHTSINPQKWK